MFTAELGGIKLMLDGTRFPLSKSLSFIIRLYVFGLFFGAVKLSSPANGLRLIPKLFPCEAPVERTAGIVVAVVPILLPTTENPCGTVISIV